MQIIVLFSTARTIEKKNRFGVRTSLRDKKFVGHFSETNLTSSGIQKQIHKPCLDHLLSI